MGTNNNNKSKDFALGLRVRFTTVGLAVAMTAASMQGCGPARNIDDQIKIAGEKDSYKEFGISPETLAKVKEIQELIDMEQEKVSNEVLIEYLSSIDSEGDFKRGKIATARYLIETEKIANALNRAWREKNEINLDGKGEENAPKFFEPNDIRIVKKTDTENKDSRYTDVYVKDKILLSSRNDSKNPIDKKIVEHFDSLFELEEYDMQFKDLSRQDAFSIAEQNYSVIQGELEKEYIYDNGKLKMGNPVRYYPFGIDEVSQEIGE